MNLLYVESDTGFIDVFRRELNILPHINITVSQTKEDAIEFSKKNLIDIFVISLDGLSTDIDDNLSIDESIEFFRYTLRNAPFTPVYFLSSSNLSAEITNALLSASHHIDVWGDGVSSPTIKVLSKDDLLILFNELSDQSNSIYQVDSIAIDSSGKRLSLKPEQKRILRIFSKRFLGTSCRVEPLDGGLSSSRVLQLCVEDNIGVARIYAVAKLDDINKIDIEVKNYSQEVIRLPARAYAPQVGIVKGGASRSAGVFYRLLSSSDIPLFPLLADDPRRAAIVITTLNEHLSSWIGDRPREQVSIKSIRQKMISDEDVSVISQKYGLDWIQEVERINVNSHMSYIHGDLHGGNVFVSDNNEPVMIDFGDVCEGPSVFDPITLELSIFTHPSMNKMIEWFPDLDNLAWADLDAYLVDCPYSDYIQACRQWSHDVAGGDQAVNAGAYAYLLRQLKYKDVEPELIKALLTSVKQSILNS